MARPPPPSLDTPLVPRRTLIGVGGVIVLGIAGWLLWDVLVVTDRERVEAIVDDATAEMTPEHIEKALHWVDVERQPLEVGVFDETRLYESGQGRELAERARTGLRRFAGESRRPLRRSIELTGDEARVSLQLVSDEGLVNVDLALRKHGDDWLVSRVHLH